MRRILFWLFIACLGLASLVGGCVLFLLCLPGLLFGTTKNEPDLESAYNDEQG